MEEYVKGLRCIGAPVWDHERKVVAAISVSGMVANINESTIDFLTDEVLRISRQISLKMDYR